MRVGSSCGLPTQPFAWASAPGSAPSSVDARGVKLRAAHAAVRLGKCTHDRIFGVVRSCVEGTACNSVLCFVAVGKNLLFIFLVSFQFFRIPILLPDKSLF